MRGGPLAWLGLLLVSTGAVLLAGLAAWWVYARHYLGIERVPGLGNFDETIGRLAPKQDGCFRFAALGDPKEGLGVYRELMEEAARCGADFAVITGDLADGPTAEAFELFDYAQAHLEPAGIPTFVAIGDHDESPLFEKYCGPRNFHFVYASSLFIFLANNDREECAQSAAYLRAQMERYAGKVAHVFIVLHRPVFDYHKHEAVRLARQKNQFIYEVLDAYKVDAVICGHLHDYARDAYNGTALIVTGGAGAKLHNEGAFHHMVLFDVTPLGFTDRVVRTSARPGLLDGLRLALVVRHYPAVFGRWWRPPAAAVGPTALVVLGSCLLRRLRSRAGTAQREPVRRVLRA